MHFIAYKNNPVFAGTNAGTWDDRIRERGYILREDSIYHLWYTGYENGKDKTGYLGYASSPDGLTWARYEDNPIYSLDWVEDIFVMRENDTYFIFYVC